MIACLRARALGVLLALVAVGAATLSSTTTWAFPGVLVSVTPRPPQVSTTELVVMDQGGLSVVTLSVDYRGPFERFALLMLVPRDVERQRLKTVKHEFVARLEQLTAPRVFEFWEQDPCVPGPPEQAWQSHVPVKNRGFLTPDVMPPRDDHYPVSNELAIPAAPVFKETENEFSYQLLRPQSSAEFQRWLEKRGYRVVPGTLEPLIDRLESDVQILVAEVAVDRAELIDGEHLQLGGIRYWSRRPLLPIFASLGKANLAPQHDLFVYTLHRENRYQAGHQKNLFAPTNLKVTAALGARVGPLYNTLFERLLSAEPGAAVTEFVGPSEECGEPCSNAPLELRELLTFGGDVLEANLPHQERPPKERPPTAPASALPAAPAGSAAGATPLPDPKQRETEQRLAAKRALLARQRYVVTRLHLRGSAKSALTDLELASTALHQSGGYGVPRGPNAELPQGVRPSQTSRYQVRFHAEHTWQGALPCAKPERFRWGKRWQSETQHWRGVDVARDLLRLGQDAKLLDAVLLDAVPEIGFEPRASSPRPPPASEVEPEPTPKPETPEDSTCAFGQGHASASGWFGLVAALGLMRWRRYRPAGAAAQYASGPARSPVGSFRASAGTCVAPPSR